ncbi:hypothetical protein I7I50_10083 [Histoplasma capsulatum G186AR]|uniref:Uncharacterized protein n=1 Tax=Ajellomyces capsulatus TaxID=5037 RepID=A0A8H7Z962_AJECA|nr:hypothetical protein I7I52_01321 [Histoplasma capsulatum]QSS68942.1 hypothetical protein I7I50_10083 [Histoplasma capsulatum G186AR]
MPSPSYFFPAMLQRSHVTFKARGFSFSPHNWRVMKARAFCTGCLSHFVGHFLIPSNYLLLLSFGAYKKKSLLPSNEVKSSICMVIE